MSLSIYNIKKWSKMLFGDSILHVKQGIGKSYEKGKIAGYYNDLTEKVTKSELNEDELPISSNEKCNAYEFPIAIFQYGLGAYDLYLQTNDKGYLKRVIKAGDWAVDNQLEDGGWRCFFHRGERNTYSSMGQGEGISLLARCYIKTKEEKYLRAMKKALNCMISPMDDGGTAYSDKEEAILYEAVGRPVVLNGWIFSVFGLYDYLILFPNDRKAKKFFDKTIKSLCDRLEQFDLGYWSKYDDGEMVASPFYHRLHISLLNALYDLTGKKVLNEYADRFNEYSNSKYNAARAFTKKAFQKITERKND